VTESEWLTCTDLTPMLIFLRGEVEPRASEADSRPRMITRHGDLVWGDGKRVSSLRLAKFAKEWCKKWWELPLDDVSRRVVVSYDQFLSADGPWDVFASARSRLWNAAQSGQRTIIPSLMFQWSLTPYGIANLVQDLAWSTACYEHRERIAELERTASDDERFAWGFFGYDFSESGATATTLYQPLPALLREVLGNPFRPVTPNRAWQTPAVQGLASGILNDNAFDRMPVLADALEEAGCDNADILSHCRSEGPHVEGCWAIDLLLGKG
jgi:hypothetical protein